MRSGVGVWVAWTFLKLDFALHDLSDRLSLSKCASKAFLSCQVFINTSLSHPRPRKMAWWLALQIRSIFKELTSFLSFLNISASFQLARSQDVSPLPTTSTELGIKHHGLVTLLRMSRKPWCEAPKQKRSKVNWAKRNWVQNDQLNVETVPTFQKLGSLKNKKHKKELFRKNRPVWF